MWSKIKSRCVKFFDCFLFISTVSISVAVIAAILIVARIPDWLLMTAGYSCLIFNPPVNAIKGALSRAFNKIYCWWHGKDYESMHGEQLLKKMTSCGATFKTKLSDFDLKTLVAAIDRNPKIQEIHLSGCDINDVNIKEIAELLSRNTHIKSLYLSYNKITDVGAKILYEALKTNTTLQKLDLSFTDIGAIGATIIQNTNIPVLRLRGIKEVHTPAIINKLNSPDSSPVELLIERPQIQYNNELYSTIKKNKKLTTLTFRYCIGFSALWSILGPNTSIKSLSYYTVPTDNQDISNFATLLKANNTVSELVISSCGINDLEAGKLAVAIKSNIALKKLDLSGNCIKELGASAIAEAIPYNLSLNSLILSNNPFQDLIFFYNEASNVLHQAAHYSNQRRKELIFAWRVFQRDASPLSTDVENQRIKPFLGLPDGLLELKIHRKFQFYKN